LLAQDALEGGGRDVRRDRAEVEPLDAREDRRGHVARVGRREDEDDVGRRLLERLQERVERGLGQLVHLVDDVDLVAPARRRILRVLAERADLLDATVRRAVDLDDVHERPGLALAAHGASPAGLGARPLGIEERPRQEPRRRGLADATRAREEVGVGDAPGRERVPERARDRVLADDRVERLRPPFPRQDLITHGLTPRAEPPAPITRHPRSKPGSRSNAMAVHPPPNDRSCDLPVEPAPVRYSHGTREGRLTVAPFRAWRGSAILVAWGPTFTAAPRGSLTPDGPSGPLSDFESDAFNRARPPLRLKYLNNPGRSRPPGRPRRALPQLADRSQVYPSGEKPGSKGMPQVGYAALCPGSANESIRAGNAVPR